MRYFKNISGEPMRSIFEYFEYREFLRDYYETQKETTHFFSYQYMGRHTNTDASYMAKILSGQRHIPIKKITDFIKLLKLKGKEAEYFEHLVNFCRARTKKEEKLYFEKMQKTRSLQGFTLSHTHEKFYSQWYYTAIRAVLGILDFVDDYERIAELIFPRITAEQARSAISFMLRIHLLERTKEGFIKPSKKHISAAGTANPKLIHGFQKQMMERAAESLENFPKEQRDFSTITAAMREDTLEDVRQILQECRENIRKRVDMDQGSNSIYQFNFQAFPLARGEM